VNTIDAGAFDKIILNQIAARAHFLVLLSPGALKRCADEGDWLRREIEAAIRLKRNIVPLIAEGFNFKKETGSLPEAWREEFRRFNGPRLFHDYFEEAMERLRNRFLKQPVYGDVILISVEDQAEVERRVEAVVSEGAPTEDELNAEAYTLRAYAREESDYDGRIMDYTEAIRLDTKYVLAFNNRGVAYYRKGDLNSAIADFTEAISINPNYADAYNNRGIARRLKSDFGSAIDDYSEAIRIDPNNASAYYNRGIARATQGDSVGAIADYSEAIRINSNYAEAYHNRGVTRNDNSDEELADYNEAIRLNPKYIDAYYNRGIVRKAKKNIRGAIDDYQKFLDLGGGQHDGKQAKVERLIRELKAQTDKA
jgi:tetratricopeptide (TPR) repeat protein